MKLVATLKVLFCPCSRINESQEMKKINEYSVMGCYSSTSTSSLETINRFVSNSN